MAAPIVHKPVLYFCGILASTENALKAAEVELINLLGKIEIESVSYVHKYTTYYSKEMGSEIFRKFVAFLPLREQIKEKLKTNLNLPFIRPVNLDPGYVDEPRVVLASCKDFNHRIALGEGVYADLHLIYRHNEGYLGLQWSYPDYTDEIAKDFFGKCRLLLRSVRRQIC